MKIFNFHTLQGINIEKSHLLACLQFCSKCRRLVDVCKLISSSLQKNENFSLHLLGPMTKFSIFNPHKSEQTSIRHKTWQELCTKSFLNILRRNVFIVIAVYL